VRVGRQNRAGEDGRIHLELGPRRVEVQVVAEHAAVFLEAGGLGVGERLGSEARSFKGPRTRVPRQKTTTGTKAIPRPLAPEAKTSTAKNPSATTDATRHTGLGRRGTTGRSQRSQYSRVLLRMTRR